MSTEWRGLLDETLAMLKDEGQDLLDEVGDRRPIVEQAVKDLVACQKDILMADSQEEAALHRESMESVLLTLESEAAIASIKAARRIKNALSQALEKALRFGFAALGGL